MRADLTPEALADARRLIAILLGHGIRIEVDNTDLLVYGTRDPDVLATIRQRKPALLAVLSEQSTTDSHPTDDWVEERHADGTTTWCRPDQVGKGPLWPSTDPAAGAPHHCDKCGNILFRQDVTGVWHCQRCDPGRSSEILELAARIRNGKPPRETKPWQRLVGATYPPRPRPQVDPQTIAEPIRLCRLCGRTRVVAGQLGAPQTICHDCWLQGRN